MPYYKQQWTVTSSDGKREYIVSVTTDGQWSCSCVGWTRHMPRDCKHIKGKKGKTNEPLESRDKLNTAARADEAAFRAASYITAAAAWNASRARATDASKSAQKSPRKTTEHPDVVSGSNSNVGQYSEKEGRAPITFMTKEAALKAGATPEQATDVARAKREEVQAKKDAKLGKMRYGFQLAEEPDLDELVIPFRQRMVAEVKYDGHLAMLIDGRIINRSGRDITLRFPEIAKVNGPAVLVGELIIPDAKGLGDFSGGIQTRNTDNPEKIRGLAATRPALFVAFDILEVAGEDVTGMRFDQRRSLLETFYKLSSLARHKLIEQTPVSSRDDILRLREAEAQRGGEGIMVKDLNAPYVAKRGRNWMKVKTWQDREFPVLRWENTGVGDGFVIYINNKGREQTVVMNDHKMRQVVMSKKSVVVEVKFLSEGEDGALRFPSVRRLVD